MNTVRIVAGIMILVLICYSAMMYAANRKVERQQYRLVKTIGDMEIRYYPKAIVATVASAGNSYMGNSNNHFRTLAGYIFGDNNTAEKISMTAPVRMDKDATGNKMSFVMPSGYDMNTLPKPNDSTVSLHYSKEGYYAVLKFGGYANEQKISRKINELKTAIANNGLTELGEYSYLGYNAPWDVVGRENEIIVEVAYSE
ncbi:hypothetical protein CAP35_07225 [Chitinophagaceae bacterium IBVUCB1]|nr:hypothetical protein CAP35_07225 [Chitinophagaceae bacterium IBVUCB1]